VWAIVPTYRSRPGQGHHVVVELAAVVESTGAYSQLFNICRPWGPV